MKGKNICSIALASVISLLIGYLLPHMQEMKVEDPSCVWARSTIDQINKQSEEKKTHKLNGRNSGHGEGALVKNGNAR